MLIQIWMIKLILSQILSAGGPFVTRAQKCETEYFRLRPYGGTLKGALLLEQRRAPNIEQSRSKLSILVIAPTPKMS